MRMLVSFTIRAATVLAFILAASGAIFAEEIVLENNRGVKLIIPKLAEGYALGTIYLNEKQVEAPLTNGIIKFLSTQDRAEYWFYADSCNKTDTSKASFSGQGEVDGIAIDFTVTLETPSDVKAVRIIYDFSVTADAKNLQAVLQYNSNFNHTWKCHIYPFAEDSKYVQEDPLTYVGIPSLFMYRDDRSCGMLWGIDPNFDYLNPTTWTGDFGLYFVDGIQPAQFRVGGRALKKTISYRCPMQIVLTDEKDPDRMIIDLMRDWIKLNDFKVEPLFVRSHDDALDLFMNGRKSTSLWYAGQGYRLEMGDPSSAFIYIGEQALSAYFDYLLFELTGDTEWRKRALEQMDFILKGQNSDKTDPNYGVVHTAFSLVDYGPAGKGFNSVDRGNNKGYKVDLNIYLGRYMLMMWQRLKSHEGIDKQDWYNSAILAIDWAIRQQNNDGGLPQKVELQPVEVRWGGQDWMTTGQKQYVEHQFGEKSRSTTSGRALPALWHIYKMTGDRKYKHVLDDVEKYNLKYVHNKYYYTSHHPDLPPYELEEASVWGLCEHWLNVYEETGEKTYLQYATSEAYLSLTWWCPKQLSWVDNPTQLGSAEQQHYLQYSIYCYQNRKYECLKRLYKHTDNVLFDELAERVAQNVYFTQITEGDLKGATHERIADPWLARSDGGKRDFNSMGTIYMSEQSLDLILQTVEMFRTGRSIYQGEDVINKVFTDGECVYSQDISNLKKTQLTVLPSKGWLKIKVSSWNDKAKAWIVTESKSEKISITTTAGDLMPNSWYNVSVNGEQIGVYQANQEGMISFSYSTDGEKSVEFEITGES